MNKNKFLIGMFALATLAFNACSKDDIPDENNGGGNTEVIEGVDTYAKFSFKLGKDGSLTRATGDKYEGTTEEKNIKNVRAYVFKESGDYEDKTEAAAIESHDVIHTAVLKLTSGRKKVYVVANMEDSWIGPTTTAAQFEAMILQLCTNAGRIAHNKGLPEAQKRPAVARVGSFENLYGQDNAGEKGFLMASVLASTEFTLNPGISEAACSKDSYASPDDMAANNHLEIAISRATSKLQATYQDDDALTLKEKDGNKEIGKLLTPTFTVRNLPIQSYMFLHNQNNGFLTPFYSNTNTSSTFVDFEKYYDEVNTPDLALSASTTGDQIKSIYLPENSNQTPVRGNTSYVLVKGTFAPVADVMINQVTVGGDAPNYTIAEKKDATNYSTGETAVPAFFTVPEWDNQIYTGTSNVEEENWGAYGLEMIRLTYLNKVGKQRWLKAKDAETAVQESLEAPKIYYIATFSGSDGIYSVVKIYKFTENKEGGSVGVYESTEESMIRILRYDSGVCYYRVNIEDNMDEKTEANNLFYSVMRNRFYNVNVSKITSIGYPTDEDVTVDPSDPINQKTYMQAHITVSQWTKVEQDTELGM